MLEIRECAASHAVASSHCNTHQIKLSCGSDEDSTQRYNDVTCFIHKRTMDEEKSKPPKNGSESKSFSVRSSCAHARSIVDEIERYRNSIGNHLFSQSTMHVPNARRASHHIKWYDMTKQTSSSSVRQQSTHIYLFIYFHRGKPTIFMVEIFLLLFIVDSRLDVELSHSVEQSQKWKCQQKIKNWFECVV